MPRRQNDHPEDEPADEREAHTWIRQINPWQIATVIGSVVFSIAGFALTTRDSFRDLTQATEQLGKEMAAQRIIVSTELSTQRLAINAVSDEVKTISGKLSTKDQTDGEQNLRLNEMSRRITIMEARGTR